MNNSILCWKSVLGTIFLMSVVCSHTRFQIPQFFPYLGVGSYAWQVGFTRNNGGPQSHMQTSVIFLNKTGPIAHRYLSNYYSATAKMLLCQSKYENLIKRKFTTPGWHLSQTAYISQRQIPKQHRWRTEEAWGGTRASKARRRRRDQQVEQVYLSTT
jgi:hypothetical protein